MSNRIDLKDHSSGTTRQGRISRATFLKGAGGLALLTISGKLGMDYYRTATKVTCRMLGPSMALGHALRDRKLSMAPPATPSLVSKVIIVGGGVAGLSAAWWLQKQGFSDFVVLELEKNVGGNSQSGQNGVSSYPWGAHYVPIANPESQYVRELFLQLGVIDRIEANGMPVYNDLYICHDPQERLLKDGTFQEGLVPNRGLQKRDSEDLRRFFDTMKQFRERQGSDGKPAFAIPLDLSSQDEEFIKLDQISMSDWLKGNDFRSKPLLWYVNYCCRDDYGSSSNNVSAWAGIHYFAGRKGTAANAEMNSVITWPEGNGFLVGELKRMLEKRIKTECMVSGIIPGKNGKVDTIFSDGETKTPMSARSECVIFAAPRFISQYIVRKSDDAPSHSQNHELSKNHEDSRKYELTYAPWMVANITLSAIPECRGEPLAWDNVRYGSESLGYVVATHQSITTRRNSPTVITYYYPLSQHAPSEARQQLLRTTTDQWCDIIIADLQKMHPNIRSQIQSIDLWPWGHGMVSPSVGFIWSDTRRAMKAEKGNVFFAHSDMSGISNFEEAQYQGVEAAKRVLERLGHTS
jgi:Protoporphyrinogen oxidase